MLNTADSITIYGSTGSINRRSTLATVLDVLTRCQADEIDLDDLELWANVIESRTDIDYSGVEGVIYALSNSEQMGELDKSKVAKLVELLAS